MPGTPLSWITGSPTSSATSDPTSNVTPNLTPNTPPQDCPPGTSSNPLPLSSCRAERLYDVFPIGLDGSSTSTRKSTFTIEPFHLYNTFTLNRGNPHVAQTVVKSAWYGKQTRSARHEFIVVLVEDLAITGLQNCMVIDRNRGGTPAGVPNYAAASSSTKAFDSFKVSYNGDLKQLLSESQLTPHHILERISFQTIEPLPLLNLVALVNHISDQHPRYHPVDANCYWFTGLIWECIRQMRPTATHQVHLQGRKGQFACVRSIPNSLQVQNVLRQVQMSIKNYNSEHPQSPNVSVLK